MRTFGKPLSILLSILVIYVGSYVGLRCTAMYWAVGLRGRNLDTIKTWVYFRDGENLATDVASVAYFPLHKAEYAWLRWTRKPLAYE